MSQTVTEWNNRASTILEMILLLPLPILFWGTVWVGELHVLLKVLIDLAVLVLFLEIYWNDVVIIRLENDVLTIVKPFRKYSLFTRKRNSQLVIQASDWDQLHYRIHKGSGSFYFRNGRTASYYFAVSGLSSWPEDLKREFADKTFHYSPYSLKTDIVRGLKKQFPERVI